MARPKRGEPGADQAAKKWRATMLEKYGGQEGLTRKMQAIGAKGGKLSTTGGFASDKVGADGMTGRERAHVAGKKGGSISRRTGVKNGHSRNSDRDIEVAERILEEESGRD